MEAAVILPLLMAMMRMLILEFVASQPVSNAKRLNESTQMQNFNIMGSMPDTVELEISNIDNSTKMKIKKNQTVPNKSLPSSPVELMRPDTFQFYTFNQNGDVIMKQMSKKEIHSLIASSGGHVPMEIYESQMIVETSTGETKVADVVQNVQNVLRTELNKPPSVMTSMPTIPGHKNSDWSHILSSILAGDIDPNITYKPDDDNDSNVMEVRAPEPTSNSSSATSTPIKSEMYDTIPMIQVAMIPAEKPHSSNDDNEKIDNIPTYHILNTITTNEKNKITHRPNQSLADTFDFNEMPDASESVRPCPLMATNCSNHNVAIQDEHNGNLTINSESAEMNKTETIIGINPAYQTTLEMTINENLKNNEKEKANASISTNIIETQDSTQNSLQLNSEKEKIIESIEYKPSLNINESNTEVHLEEWNGSTGKPHNQAENGESDVAILVMKKPIVEEKINHEETAIAITENSTISHEIPSTNNKISIMKLGLASDQRIHSVNDNQSMTNDRNDMLNETHNISPTQDYGISYYDETLSTQPPNISYGSLSSVTPLDYTSTKIFTSISQINETYSSTKIHVPPTTIAPISPEKYADIIPDETTKHTIENINLNTPSDIVFSHEIYTQSTTSLPIVLEEPTDATASTELIQTELANSLSSMISQISIAVPSIIPSTDQIHISQNFTHPSEIDDENTSQSTIKNETKLDNSGKKNNTMNLNTSDNGMGTKQNANNVKNWTEIIEKPHSNIEKPFVSNNELDTINKRVVEKIHETPIVRIDIMETVPNITQNNHATLVNNSHDNFHIDNINTESPMVRIKLTDPISTLNHILESSPVQQSTIHGIEIVTLPTNGNISSNIIGSGLIAGFISNTNESASSKYSEFVSHNKSDELVYNETMDNTDSPMREAPVTLNTIPFSKITETQTQSIDISHVSSPNPTEINRMPITNSSSITEPMKTGMVPICSNQNSSFVQTDISNTSLCSFSTDMTYDDNETTTNAAEEIIVRPSHPSTTVSPYASTKSFITNEIPNQKSTSHNPTMTDSQKTRIDHTTETVENITGMNKIQVETKLTSYKISTTTSSKLEYVNEHVSEHTISSKLHENNKNDSTIMVANKLKDKKTDNSSITSPETEVPEKIAIIYMKPNNTSAPIHKPATLNKLNLTQEMNITENWRLIPQKNHSITQNNSWLMTNPAEHRIDAIQKESDEPSKTSGSSEPKGASGLDSSVEKLDADISYFSILCNDLAFKYWSAVNSGLNTSRSIALSPFGLTSLLAMLFLGARSSTSDKMNEVLKLDDVTSFNPHLIFQNITDSVGIAQNQGIANVAFVRELFTDQSKVRKLMRFYKKQAEQFYDGMVEQVNFSTISDSIRRKTNFLIRKQTGGRIRNFVKTNTVPLRSPLAALSANVFQTDCNSNDATSRGRDGELYFAVSPAVRQRKLVLVPATLWKTGVLAGYEPSLDATAYAIGGIDKIVSTIFVVPGQQGSTATDDNLDLLEQRIISGVLHDAAWNKLLKVIVPRTGLELQIPKFSHNSIVNATAALKIMGLEDLFEKCADFKGINGVGNDFHLADVMQMNMFSTCGDENIQSGKTKHHVETYPTNSQRNARESKYDDNENDAVNNGLHKHIFTPLKSLETMNTSFTTSTTETMIGDRPRVKLDKPFLYFVRHNPTGLILFMGRFNPRLLP